VQEALAIDRRTGTTFWRDAIAKEMKNFMVAFEFQCDDKVPIGYKQIPCHMIFDIYVEHSLKIRPMIICCQYVLKGLRKSIMFLCTIDENRMVLLCGG
jgi:hypothetical protein